MWVMNEWAKSSGGKGKILFLSDGNLDFTKAVGMENDMSAPGFGIRSKRYSMIVEDGVVRALNIEQAPGTTELSGAAAILEQL
jgi:peroxiredoxin